MSQGKVSMKQIIQKQGANESVPPSSSNSVRKFTKTNIQTQSNNNFMYLEHVTEPRVEADKVIDTILQQIFNKISRQIVISSSAGQFAIDSTLSVLINDPNLGILDSKQVLEQHKKSVINADAQPKPNAFIDGSVGHVKVQQPLKKPKQQCQQQIKKTLSHKLSKNGRMSRIRYSNINRKQLQTLNTNLSPILQRKGTFQSQNTSTQQPNIVRNKKKQKNRIRDSISNGKSSYRFSQQEQSDISKRFINLGIQPDNLDDNFINYLRYVKDQRAAEKNKIGEISISRRNSKLSNVNITAENITEKDTILKQRNFNSQITPKLTTKTKIQSRSKGKKKTFNLQSFVVVNEGNLQTNMYSYDKQALAKKQQQPTNAKAQKKTKAKQEKQQKQREQKSKNIDNINLQIIQNAQSKRSNKDTSKNMIKPQLKSKRIAKDALEQINSQAQSCNKQIKLPQLSLRRNSRASQALLFNNKTNIQTQITLCQQVSVWLKQKQKIKQFDHKLAQFINANSLKSSVQIRATNCNEDNLISELKQYKNDKKSHNKADFSDMEQLAQKRNPINNLPSLQSMKCKIQTLKQQKFKKQKQNLEPINILSTRSNTKQGKTAKLVGVKGIQSVQTIMTKLTKTGKKSNYQFQQQRSYGNIMPVVNA